MLVKLLPDQISRYWQVISHAIEVAAPPTVQCSPNRMNNILQSLLGGGMQCWAITEPRPDNKMAILGVVVTTVTEDFCSGTKNLFVYALYSYSDKLIAGAIWKDFYETLRKFGKSRGCFQVTGYTNNPAVSRSVRDILKGNTECRLIRLEI